MSSRPFLMTLNSQICRRMRGSTLQGLAGTIVFLVGCVPSADDIGSGGPPEVCLDVQSFREHLANGGVVAQGEVVDVVTVSVQGVRSSDRALCSTSAPGEVDFARLRVADAWPSNAETFHAEVWLGPFAVGALEPDSKAAFAYWFAEEVSVSPVINQATRVQERWVDGPSCPSLELAAELETASWPDTTKTVAESFWEQRICAVASEDAAVGR